MDDGNRKKPTVVDAEELPSSQSSAVTGPGDMVLASKDPRDLKNDDRPKRLKVERRPMSPVAVYEITAQELNDVLSTEGSTSQDLAFGTFTGGVGVTALVALSSVPPAAAGWHIALWNAGIGGVVAGLYFLLRWYRGKKRHDAAIAEIRNRAPQVETYSLDDE